MADETITESEIWADIDAMFTIPVREPGDIDVQQWADHFGISETTARNQIAKLAKMGDWQILEVHDDSSANGRRKIIRRVKKNVSQPKLMEFLDRANGRR